MTTLRPYQQEVVDRVRAVMQSGARRVVLQMGTGAGKTRTATVPIEDCANRGGKVDFLAHLDAIIDDTFERLEAAGVNVGVVQGNRKANPSAPVQVGSLQTLDRRGIVPNEDADLVFVDECHRANAESVRRVLDKYKRARLIGLTATPQRGDGAPLGDVWEALVCGPSNRWLTDHGHIVPVDLIAPKGYSSRGLAIDPVAAYEQSTPGTRALVFAGDKKHARELVERFNERGWRAELLVGETKRATRRELKARLLEGDVQILVGCTVFLEGWDAPEVETIILARAFTTTGAFLQAIGRGSRPSPETGKQRCTVLDLRGAWELHGLPDEDRRWTLEGDAVRRIEQLEAIARCGECFAMFRPQGTCPLCGAAVSVKSRVRVVRTRAEKIENVSHLSQTERDKRYVGALWQRIRVIPKLRMMPTFAQREWVLKQFQRRHLREPECTV